MVFFFRAVFWIAAVAAFVPVGFTAPTDGAFARNVEIFAETTFQGELTDGLAASEACEGREDLCDVAGEFTSFAGWAFSLAAQRVDDAIETHLSEHEGVAEAREIARSAEDVFASAAEVPAR